VTDSNGDTVWRGASTAWGRSLRESTPVEWDTPQNLRFQGQYLDRETGLHYNTFRYYDPAAGCYTQMDPIGLLGGLNLYIYTPNPLSWIDPLGLSCGKAKMQPYREDVMVKGPHADIFVNNRKVAEARLGNDGKWFRWGEMTQDRKLLKEADKVVSGMLNDKKIMAEAISQTKQALNDFEQILKNEKVASPIYQQAERGIERFGKLLEIIQ